ncbi:MAG: FKBP-type peptidyl-prolyl cis-trans isomerase [Gammaproteobacteria bacterium]|nr:FKBP-type peptidyl-prolyl cis-trans isomerase [Gammaproteobacteria bacterium]NIR98053.1 FKBP-type peptidyl-prolyl cis-trans isomerase [Gammaproteobacteria bacterium]NIT63763.1 FKBP-type peptidyl-prolyl cis-trans isomerase [Gammaproteobacteria bacterium]NIV20713.1 FKBP-type peptidyl-prolyl cis-trans isomerase [Gammaproteobacteria bacterium]NIY32343.1 FKBP-type peptidyl-prolyl cis-trans isomerase [Gammaproteobacteria bacterium]
MHFSIELEDGTVAESSFDGEPIRFVMGDGTLIRGLELALYGLGPGDRQSLRIDAETAFGHRDSEAVQVMPRSDFPPEMSLEPGLIIGFTTPSGEEIPGAVREVEEDRITVDFNHPLAGHEIKFDVQILEVEPPPAGDLEHT